MFLAVIVELAYSHLRHFMLPCVSPHPFGVDLIFFRNLFGCVILRDVEVLFGQDTLVRFGFHHQFNVRTADERLLAADARSPKFRFLYQFIYVLPSYAHQLCSLGKREEILPLGGLSRLQYFLRPFQLPLTFPNAFLVAKIGTLVATITSRCLLSYKWFSTPLANLSYFHIFLVYIGGNFALFLPIFVNTCKPLSTHVN